MKFARDIRGVTCNSREVEPGYAFVAINGTKHDGHDYIEEALARGASFIIVEKPINLDTNVPVIQVKDGRIALAELAAAVFGHPSKYLQTIGVTGTNGKTTTTFIIHHLFNQNSVGCGLLGTVDIDTGVRKLKAHLTTPDAVHLQQYLREMVDAGLKAASMEVSSHGIEQKRAHGVDFDLTIFTNLSHDHFDFHGNFENYLRTKKSLFEQMESDGLAFLNADDQYCEYIAEGLQARVIRYGVEKDAVIRAENIRRDNIKTYYDLVVTSPLDSKYARIKPMRLPIMIKLPGKHNIYNTLAACGASLLMGLSGKQVQNIAHFDGVWRRFHILRSEDFLVIDDCAHNPGSYNAVFETVRDLSFNRLFVINAIRGNRGLEVNRDNSKIIAHWVKEFPWVKLWITNCAELVHENDLVSEAEEDVFLQTLQSEGVDFEHSAEIKPLIRQVLKEVKPGDLILLLGAHAMDKAGELIVTEMC